MTRSEYEPQHEPQQQKLNGPAGGEPEQLAGVAESRQPVRGGERHHRGRRKDEIPVGERNHAEFSWATGLWMEGERTFPSGRTSTRSAAATTSARWETHSTGAPCSLR